MNGDKGMPTLYKLLLAGCALLALVGGFIAWRFTSGKQAQSPASAPTLDTIEILPTADQLGIPTTDPLLIPTVSGLIPTMASPADVTITASGIDVNAYVSGVTQLPVTIGMVSYTMHFQDVPNEMGVTECRVWGNNPSNSAQGFTDFRAGAGNLCLSRPVKDWLYEWASENKLTQ